MRYILVDLEHGFALAYYVLRISVWRIKIRDPVLFWPLDRGWKKSPDPGWTSQSLETVFRAKNIKFFDADPDPGSGIFLTLDPGSEMENLDPQRCQLCYWWATSVRFLCTLKDINYLVVWVWLAQLSQHTSIWTGNKALYSPLFQNLVYVNIVYSALYELSDGNPTKYPFELFLFVFMVASIVSGME